MKFFNLFGRSALSVESVAEDVAEVAEDMAEAEQGIGELINVDFGRLPQTLNHMWQGMLSIFIVIGVIILCIYGMNKLFNSLAAKKKAKEEAKNSENN